MSTKFRKLVAFHSQKLKDIVNTARGKSQCLDVTAGAACVDSAEVYRVRLKFNLENVRNYICNCSEGLPFLRSINW
jgi:hypothetical protein